MTTLCQDTMILGIITALSGLLNWGFAKETEETLKILENFRSQKKKRRFKPYLSAILT